MACCYRSKNSKAKKRFTKCQAVKEKRRLRRLRREQEQPGECTYNRLIKRLPTDGGGTIGSLNTDFWV